MRLQGVLFTLSFLALTVAGTSTFGQPSTDLMKPFSPDQYTLHLLHLDDVASGQCADAMGGLPAEAREASASLGRFGGGLSLDGARGWIDLMRPANAPAAEKAVTVECWAKFWRQAAGDLICRNTAYLMRLNGGLEAMFYIDGQWRRVQGSRPVPIGRWTHLAMSYDSTDQTIRLYIDGRLDIARKPDGLTEGRLSRGSDRLRLGTNDWNPTASVMNGVLDEIRVSSIARTYEPLALPRAFVPEKINLLLNPGFELGRHGWRPDGEADGDLQWELCAGETLEGRHFLRSREAGRYALLSYPVRISPGKRLTLSVALRADKDAESRLSLVSTRQAPGARQIWRNQAARLGRAWQRFSLAYDVPLDFPTDYIYVRLEKPQNAQLDVDAVSLVVGDNAEFSPTEATQCGARLALPPGHTFSRGASAQIPITVFNYSSQPKQLGVRILLTDWQQQKRAEDTVFAGLLPPGEKALTWRLPTEFVSWYTLTVETSLAGRVISRVPYVVNVIEEMAGPAEAAFPSPLGINTHMEREPGEHLRRNLRMLARCGVKWIRAWWGWGMAEKQPGQFDWTEYDRQYHAVHEAGMQIMPILLRYYPQYEQAWAGKMDQIQQPPYDLQQWGNFVEATVRRYKGRIRAWEVWNEPIYTMDAQTYAGILKTTYERAKAADPEALIVGFGGVSLDYIRDTFAAGAAHALDVLSHHSYSQLAEPFSAMAQLQENTLAILRQANVNVPIWHTEQGTGADGAGYLGLATSEEACAANLQQAYLSALSAGVQKFFWFSAQTSPTYGWGVYYEDYIPRPRLIALNGLARMLQRREVRGRRALAEGRMAAVWLDGPAGPAAVLWNIAEEMAIMLPRAGLQFADMLGNPLPLRGEHVRLLLRRGEPILIVAPGLSLHALQQRLEQAAYAPAAERPFTLRFLPAAPNELRATVRNDSAASLDLDLRLHASPLLKEMLWEIRDLPPGETATRLLALESRLSRGQILNVQIAATLGGVRLRTLTLSSSVRF